MNVLRDMKNDYESRLEHHAQYRKRSIPLLHPLMLFVPIWALCFLLYALHLSRLLAFTTDQVLEIVLWIIVPYVITVCSFQIVCFLSPKRHDNSKYRLIENQEYFVAIETRIIKWFFYWCTLSLVEIIFSRGLPILWLIENSSRSYTEFGLPVVHVIATSLLSVLALSELGIYLQLGNKRRLLIPLALILWSIATVSRSLILVSFLQWGVLWVFFRGAPIRTVLRFALIILIVVYIFGYIGDTRSGGEAFLSVAEPSWNYPVWLPSGFLWFYIYLTTPLGNLVNTSMVATPLHSIFFPNTLYLAFPTAIRNVVYGSGSTFGGSGELVTESFNVSTAYIGPYLDYGHFGLLVFSLILGLLAAYYWRRRKTFRDNLIYALIAQCLVFSIFFNFLFYNPVIGQVFWIYFLFRKFSSPKKIRSIESVLT